MTRTDEQQTEGAAHIGYELAMLAQTSRRLRDGIVRDAVEHNAYVESELVHARGLISFLVNTPQRDDMAPKHFVSGWDPDAVLGAEKVTELRETCDYISKRLAHLTWTRIADGEGPSTLVGSIFDAMGRFVHHLEAHGAPAAETLRGCHMQALCCLNES